MEGFREDHDVGSLYIADTCPICGDDAGPMYIADTCPILGMMLNPCTLLKFDLPVRNQMVKSKSHKEFHVFKRLLTIEVVF